ncbi:MAG: hypothetical protein ABI165_07020 [Bryobacteraceae bacterium]
MKKLAALLLLNAWVCCGQTSSSITLSNGVHLRISASFGAAGLTTDMAAASGNSFYRIFRDRNGLAVFAYELAIERTSDEDLFQITVKPAGTEFAQQFPGADGGKPTPTIPETRQLPLLRSGERTSINLYQYLRTQDPVIDTIEVRLNESGGSVVTGAARPDGAIEFSGLQVSINRQPVTAPGPRGAVAGRYAMFYLPGRGGYFFSTDAPAGRAFSKVGTVDGNRLRFTLDNENFDCVADAPILVGSSRGSGSGEMWVYHDAAYRPRGNWTVGTVGADDAARAQKEFFAAASDSLRWWLP